MELRLFAHFCIVISVVMGSSIGLSYTGAAQCSKIICLDGVEPAPLIDTKVSLNNPDFKNLRELIKKHYELERENSFELFAKLKASPEFLARTKIRDSLNDLFLLQYTLDALKTNSRYLVKDPKTDLYRFDFETYAHEIPVNSQRIIPGMREIIESLTNSIPYRFYISGINWKSHVELAQHATTREARSVVNAQMAFNFERIEKEYDDLMGIAYQRRSTTQKALSYQELSPEDGRVMLELFMKTHFIERTLHGPLQGIFSKLNFSKTPQYQSLFGAPLSAVESAVNKALPDRQMACLKNVELILQASLSSRDLTKLAQTGRIAKELSKRELQYLLAADPDLIPQVDKKIEDIRFNLPSERFSIRDFFVYTFKNLISVDLKERGMNLKPDALVSRYLLFASALANNRFTTQAHFSECNEQQPYFLSDHALTALGQISLSNNNGKDSRMGLAVTAHEIGHIVFSAIYGKLTFNESKTDIIATSENNPKMLPLLRCEAGRLKNQYQYLDESFADGFSAHVLKHYTRPEDKINLACSMLGLRYGEPSLVNPSPEDTHPSDFLRSLIIFQDLFEIQPNECRDYLSSVNYPSITSCY